MSARTNRRPFASMMRPHRKPSGKLHGEVSCQWIVSRKYASSTRTSIRESKDESRVQICLNTRSLLSDKRVEGNALKGEILVWRNRADASCKIRPGWIQCAASVSKKGAVVWHKRVSMSEPFKMPASL